MILQRFNLAQHLPALFLVAGLTISPISQGAEAGLARGQLYSTAATNKICGMAQQIVATTSVEVNNSIYSEWDGFVQSDATPYSVTPGFPTPNYNPPQAPDLPFTSTQHVIYGFYGTGNRDYPQVVSCKMKNAEYLVKTGLDTGAVDQSCAAVNEFYVNDVIASLTNPEQAVVVMEDDDVIEIDPDDGTSTGSGWTAGFPDDPYPVLYRESEGGPLHVKSRTLVVPTNTPTILVCNANPFLQGFSFCEPRKWGIRYCHLPAPEYIRAALTNEVSVPILPDGPQ
jgi:hypothetical protein